MRYVVINLEREPQRLADFHARNEQTKLAIDHFQAVDGAKLTAIDTTILAPGASYYSPPMVATAMSHLALWKECASSDMIFVVFEDDVHLRRDLGSQLHKLCGSGDWDLVLLGCNMDTTIELNLSPDIDLAGRFSVRYPSVNQLDAFAATTEPVAPCRLRVAFGTSAYAVTPKGAALLIEKCFPLDNRVIHLKNENRSVPAHGIDCMMIAAYPALHAYLCLPPLAMTPNNRAISQVQRR